MAVLPVLCAPPNTGATEHVDMLNMLKRSPMGETPRPAGHLCAPPGSVGILSAIPQEESSMLSGGYEHRPEAEGWPC